MRLRGCLAPWEPLAFAHGKCHWAPFQLPGGPGSTANASKLKCQLSSVKSLITGEMVRAALAPRTFPYQDDLGANDWDPHQSVLLDLG
jgi:hypothetical protein